MNTLIVAGSILLIAIAGSIYFKYQDHKMVKEEGFTNRARTASPIFIPGDTKLAPQVGMVADTVQPKLLSKEIQESKSNRTENDNPSNNLPQTGT